MWRATVGYFCLKEFEVTTAAVKPTRKRLTRKQWAEIEALWESGAVIYEDLVKKFGLNQSSFERHFKKRGIVKGAKAEATKKKVEEKLAQAAIDEATVIAARIKETKEQHYTMSSNLSKLAWAEILQAKKDLQPVAVAMNNLKALDKAMDILKKAREERWAILGLDRPDAVDPEELPELIISELTAEQIEELRRRDESELEDLPGTANQNALQPNVEDSDEHLDEDDGVVEEG